MLGGGTHHGARPAPPPPPPSLPLPPAQHNFANTGQRYERLTGLLRPGTEYSSGLVLGAEVQVMDARAMWAVAKAALEADPGCLTERLSAGAEEHHHLVESTVAGVWRYKVTVGPAANPL